MTCINLIAVARDVEGWIAPHVLSEAGFVVMNTFWLDIPGLNCKRATADTEDLHFLWHGVSHEYPVILCTHSLQQKGLVVRGGKNPEFWSHDTFADNRRNNHMLYLWTCFCDFQTRQPTNWINLPGFNHQGRPGYFAVEEEHKSCRYRRWLAIVQQHYNKQSQPAPKTVAQMFAEILTPRLQKYENTTRQKWLFFEIQNSN